MADRLDVHRECIALGALAMSRDEDGISNSYWLILGSLLASLAVAITAFVTQIV